MLKASKAGLIRGRVGALAFRNGEDYIFLVSVKLNVFLLMRYAVIQKLDFK